MINVYNSDNEYPKNIIGLTNRQNKKFGAVIIENRFDVLGIINEHKKFLPKDCVVYYYSNKEINSFYDYNLLLSSVEFWDSLLFDKVLIFQHDSALLREGIEEFLQWDYVGAPWKFQQHGGNGGLSIRNPKAMIACIKKQPWNPSMGNEDVYFSNLLKDMPEFKLAPREVCEAFSVESIYKLGTLGYHAIDKYLTPEEVNKIKTQYE